MFRFINFYLFMALVFSFLTFYQPVNTQPKAQSITITKIQQPQAKIIKPNIQAVQKAKKRNIKEPPPVIPSLEWKLQQNGKQ